MLGVSLTDFLSHAEQVEQWDGYAWQPGADGRRGGWISTFSGRKFYPLDPRPEEIEIVDIAHALSRQCRFSGHCHGSEPYSVAQHSVEVAKLLPPALKIAGLLHDASEAYLVDLPRPLKHSPGFADGYRSAETELMRCVGVRFGIGSFDNPLVEVADQRLLKSERRDLMHADCQWDVPGVKPVPHTITPWPCFHSEQTFLSIFEKYEGR